MAAKKRAAKKRAAKKRAAKKRQPYWYAVTRDGLDMPIGRMSRTDALWKARYRALLFGRGPIARLYHLEH